MVILILSLILILVSINTIILATFLALVSKVFKTKEEPAKKNELVDVVMNSSNYGDQRAVKPLSTDIVLLRDE